MGRVDVDQMLAEMSPEQLDEWMAYYSIEPFGDQWRQVALLAALGNNSFLRLLAAHGVKVSQSEWKNVADFMPVQTAPEPENTDPYTSLRQLTARHGVNRTTSR